MSKNIIEDGHTEYLSYDEFKEYMKQWLGIKE